MKTIETARPRLRESGGGEVELGKFGTWQADATASGLVSNGERVFDYTLVSESNPQQTITASDVGNLDLVTTTKDFTQEICLHDNGSGVIDLFSERVQVFEPLSD